MVALGPVEVSGAHFDEARFLAMRGRTSLLGLDLLLSRGALSLGKWGVHFGHATPASGAYGTAEIETIHGDPARRNFVTGIAVRLDIDGEPESCYLDTGRTVALAGTAALPISECSAKKGLDIEFNGFGEFGLTRFHRREAHVRIGSWETDIPFRHLHADRSAAQPFVLGGGILKQCDINLSLNEGIATFYPSGALQQV